MCVCVCENVSENRYLLLFLYVKGSMCVGNYLFGFLRDQMKRTRYYTTTFKSHKWRSKTVQSRFTQHDRDHPEKTITNNLTHRYIFSTYCLKLFELYSIITSVSISIDLPGHVSYPGIKSSLGWLSPDMRVIFLAAKSAITMISRYV